MIDILTNKWLRIEVSDEGAEFQRISGRQTGIEYLWSGNPTFWDRRSPLLFPIVGRLNNHRALIDNEEYFIPKHGFVSSTRFKKTGADPHSLTYQMESSPQMHKLFPFPFNLSVNYRLRSNFIVVTWFITNTGLYSMPFHIGGHPGIMYPQFNPRKRIKAYASFGCKGPIESASVGPTGCLSNERYKLDLHNNLLAITDDCFKNDAIIIDKKQVNHISILDPDKKPYVSMDFNSPVLLLWSPYNVKAPFVCLEPWYGLCDAEDYNGEFRNRPYTQFVEPGKRMKLGYTLRFDAEQAPTTSKQKMA